MPTLPDKKNVALPFSKEISFVGHAPRLVLVLRLAG
jgi:hypothetical protein